VVLIEKGATHNFIDEEFMSNKGLKTQEFPIFEVAIGNVSPT